MIWFDFDNSPHVPLFIPVLKIFDSKKIEYKITARDFAQTLALLKLWNIEHTPIGSHGGKNKIKKILNTYNRSSQLKSFAKGYKFSLAVSHGSRSQLIAASRLGVKSLLMLDYEYTETRIFNHYAGTLLMPKLIPASRLGAAGINLKKVMRYDGFKEELYLNSFVPDPGFRKIINVPEEHILVVIRPPGMTGNYHDKNSEHLLTEALNYFSSFENLTCLIIARTDKDRNYILSKAKLNKNIRFLEKAVDGPQLVYAADIVLSGGGTMNRESALLGTKTLSIFTGKKPYLDEYLAEKGRMTFIESVDEIKNIPVVKSAKTPFINPGKNLADEIASIITELAG